MAECAVELVTAEEEELDPGPFGVKSPLHDFCIAVEGKELFASKAILSAMSQVFEKLCSDQSFEEAKKQKVELKDQKYSEILTMLKCIIQHPSVDPITDENLDVLLKLGRQYLIRFLLERCKDFMVSRIGWMKDTDEASFRYLKLAGSNNMEHVMDDLIEKLVRKASNIELSFVTSNDADLPLEAGFRFYKHIVLKMIGNRHSIAKQQTHFIRFCAQCSKSQNFYECDHCNDPICTRCLASLKKRECHPVPPCRKCGEMTCMCEFNNTVLL